MQSFSDQHIAAYIYLVLGLSCLAVAGYIGDYIIPAKWWDKLSDRLVKWK